MIFAALAVIMAACSGSRDRSGDVRTELLSYVPDKTAVVVSLNPQKIFRSAGGDWTEEKGIEFGPYIEECIKGFGGDFEELKPEISKYLKIKGLNPESFLFATNNGVYDWFMLAALADKAAFVDYMKSNDVEFESKGSYDVYGKRKNYMVIDNDEALVWVLNDDDADEAIKSIKNIKSRASDKPMPDWATAYLGSGDNEFAAVGSFDAMGVNLGGLLRLANVPSDLLGGDISYIAVTACDKDHKFAGALATLDANGKNVPLLNQKIYDNADLSAMDLLPAECNSKAGIGISGKEIFEYIPQLKSAMADARMAEALESVQSLAFGIGSVDKAGFDAAMYGVGGIPEFPVKGAVAVVKCAPGKSSLILKLIAENVPGINTVDANTLKLDVDSSQIKGLDAVYFSDQNGAVVISTENLKVGNASVGAPAKTLAYSYADNKIYSSSDNQFAFMAEMIKSSTGRWDADGICSEMEFTDKCPGALAFLCKIISVYAPEAMKAADNVAEEETIDDEWVAEVCH